MSLRHFQEILIDKVKTETNNPQNWRIKKWLNDDTIHIKRLLKDMEREGIITITFENDNGKIRRIITPIEYEY